MVGRELQEQAQNIQFIKYSEMEGYIYGEICGTTRKKEFVTER